VLELAQQTVSNSHRITLERIAETWYRIADSLPAKDAYVFNGQFKVRSSTMALPNVVSLARVIVLRIFSRQLES